MLDRSALRMDLFYKASRMCISIDKSCFLYNNVDIDIRSEISKALPYKMEPISTGFMYLGYFLKPLGYRVRDWHWLIKKFEHRISHWAHKLLSLGGLSDSCASGFDQYTCLLDGTSPHPCFSLKQA